jgi:hypothetical protein
MPVDASKPAESAYRSEGWEFESLRARPYSAETHPRPQPDPAKTASVDTFLTHSLVAAAGVPLQRLSDVGSGRPTLDVVSLRRRELRV